MSNSPKGDLLILPERDLCQGHSGEAGIKRTFYRAHWGIYCYRDRPEKKSALSKVQPRGGSCDEDGRDTRVPPPVPTSHYFSPLFAYFWADINITNTHQWSALSSLHGKQPYTDESWLSTELGDRAKAERTVSKTKLHYWILVIKTLSRYLQILNQCSLVLWGPAPALPLFFNILSIKTLPVPTLC